MEVEARRSIISDEKVPPQGKAWVLTLSSTRRMNCRKVFLGVQECGILFVLSYLFFKLNGRFVGSFGGGQVDGPMGQGPVRIGLKLIFQ